VREKKIIASKFYTISEDKEEKSFIHQTRIDFVTHHLSLFPYFHGRFVFLKLVTPVSVNFLIIIAFAWRCTPAQKENRNNKIVDGPYKEDYDEIMKLLK
jgi:hypothetical protein